MEFIIDQIWDWLVIGVYRKFGWEGAAAAILVPILVIGLLLWLLVMLVTG